MPTTAKNMRQITLRVPVALYRQVQQAARQKRTTVSRLARQQLERLALEEQEARLADSFELLADDPESDVEDFFAAQSEVTLTDPNEDTGSIAGRPMTAALH